MRGKKLSNANVWAVVSLLTLSLISGATVHADRFTSTNYTIDASSVGSSISGRQNSTSYQLVSSGGESVVGNGTSGSYKLGEGYVAQLDQSIQLSLSPTTVNFGGVTPGTSNLVNLTANILTDAPGYNLSTHQDTDLTSGANTIPAVSGSIASPVTWVEGTTKGLGFSLASTNATALPAKWNAGASYAAFPGTDTTFYTRTGLSGGNTDSLSINIRLDVAASQPTGNYTNTVTWIGTTTP